MPGKLTWMFLKQRILIIPFSFNYVIYVHLFTIWQAYSIKNLNF
ncbi:glycine betaine, L-proline ABC transporter, permease protein [Listeria marthii FSL S4-120]|uniref:Glycine betaine, L-proline ABC transporter, permease protein n=1 Tax=Listeria marthii FSL S4-120 TaxID=702457 RepID=A0ABP2K420_9LIST|nr:glycine betaine, L-proline ABC transporter, permease protein [Listeria marthii FSL S4-120]